MGAVYLRGKARGPAHRCGPSSAAAPRASLPPPRRRRPPSAQEKDGAGWERAGGLAGVAAALHTSLHDGIDADAAGPASIARRQQVYGANRFKEVPAKNFFALWFGNLQDPTLIMLMVAALVSLRGAAAGGAGALHDCSWARLGAARRVGSEPFLGGMPRQPDPQERDGTALPAPNCETGVHNPGRGGTSGARAAGVHRGRGHLGGGAGGVARR